MTQFYSPFIFDPDQPETEKIADCYNNEAGVTLSKPFEKLTKLWAIRGGTTAAENLSGPFTDSTIDQIQSLSGQDLPSGRRDPEQLLLSLLDSGQFEEAISLTNQLLDQATDNIARARALNMLAKCHFSMGNPIKAVHVARQAIDSDPNNTDALLAIGYDAIRRHDIAEVKNCCKKIINLPFNDAHMMFLRYVAEHDGLAVLDKDSYNSILTAVQANGNYKPEFELGYETEMLANAAAKVTAPTGKGDPRSVYGYNKEGHVVTKAGFFADNPLEHSKPVNKAAVDILKKNPLSDDSWPNPTNQ